jgi:hypothetical protein
MGEISQPLLPEKASRPLREETCQSPGIGSASVPIKKNILKSWHFLEGQKMCLQKPQEHHELTTKKPQKHHQKTPVFLKTPCKNAMQHR